MKPPSTVRFITCNYCSSFNTFLTAKQTRLQTLCSQGRERDLMLNTMPLKFR